MEAYLDFWPKIIKCSFWVRTCLFLIKMNYLGLQGIVWTLEMLVLVFPGTLCLV